MAGQEQETYLHIRVWGVILVAVAVFGYFFATVLNHETRLSKVEPVVAEICARYDNIDKKLDSIRSEQTDVYKRLLSRQQDVDNRGRNR